MDELAPTTIPYLRPIYEAFHSESAWPVLRRIQHSLVQNGDRVRLQDLIEAAPRNLVLHDFSTDEVRLSARGIYVVIGPDAEELRDALLLIRIAVQQYREDPNAALTNEQALEAGLSSGRAQRAHMILRNEPYLWSGGSWNDTSWQLPLSGDIWEFSEVQTVDDYFELSQRFRVERVSRTPTLPSLAPTETRLVGSSRDVGELVGLQRLHKNVVDASGGLFADGYFAQAIFEAFKAIEIRVREQTGLDKSGRDLMAHVFKDTDPLIDIAVERGRAGSDEREGFRLIFMGVMTGIRNPKAHGQIQQTDAQRTMEYLAFASLLMRRLDDAIGGS